MRRKYYFHSTHQGQENGLLVLNVLHVQYFDETFEGNLIVIKEDFVGGLKQ